MDSLPYGNPCLENIFSETTPDKAGKEKESVVTDCQSEIQSTGAPSMKTKWYTNITIQIKID